MQTLDVHRREQQIHETKYLCPFCFIIILGRKNYRDLIFQKEKLYLGKIITKFSTIFVQKRTLMSREICISMDFFFKILEIKSYNSLLDFHFVGTLFRMEVKSDHDT